MSQQLFTVPAGENQRIPDTLQQHGVCLVKGVVHKSETSRWRGGALHWVAGLTGADLNSPDCVYERSNWPHDRDDPIFSGYGAGHLPEAWEARMHSGVQAAFAAANGSAQLVTSFDATNVERPRSTPLEFSKAVHLHTDQRKSAPGAPAECFQGVLSLTPTRALTGGTTVLVRSHLHHHKLQCVPHDRDWYLLKEPDLDLMQSLQPEGVEMVHVETDAGDLLLWDSRTVHCGRRARSALPHTAWRVAFYICMADAAKLTAADRQRKRGLLGLTGGQAETTCHWPDGRAMKPRRGTVGITRPTQRVLDSRKALQLAGAEPYGDGGDGGGAV